MIRMRCAMGGPGCLSILIAGAAFAADAPDYARDIQPILASRCYPCHSDKVQMHGLRLDRKADAFGGGSSGTPSIVPGNSARSLLIRYVSGVDRGVVMPPNGPRLEPAQIEMLRRWIDNGAHWPDEEVTAAAPKRGADHWAFSSGKVY